MWAFERCVALDNHPTAGDLACRQLRPRLPNVRYGIVEKTFTTAFSTSPVFGSASELKLYPCSPVWHQQIPAPSRRSSGERWKSRCSIADTKPAAPANSRFILNRSVGTEKPQSKEESSLPATVLASLHSHICSSARHAPPDNRAESYRANGIRMRHKRTPGIHSSAMVKIAATSSSSHIWSIRLPLNE